jgi:hypothetical protein
MAILRSGAGKFREINDDDYRSYLITRNQEPIVYHSQDMQFKRLQVYVRSALNRINRFLHWVSDVIIKSQHRKIQRELMMLDVDQHYAPHDRDDSTARIDRKR